MSLRDWESHGYKFVSCTISPSSPQENHRVPWVRSKSGAGDCTEGYQCRWGRGWLDANWYVLLCCIWERCEHLLCDSMARWAAIATRKTSKCGEEMHLCSILTARSVGGSTEPSVGGWHLTGFTALISGVIRLQAVTLGEFTLNLIFIVSRNGNCFLPVNKAVGALPYNGCE